MRKHIIIFNKDYRENFNYTIVDDTRLLSLFINRDTPIKEFCSDEFRENNSYITDLKSLLETRHFYYNGIGKITLNGLELEEMNRPETLDKLLLNYFRLHIIDGYYKEKTPYDTDSFDSRIKEEIRQHKLNLIC